MNEKEEEVLPDLNPENPEALYEDPPSGQSQSQSRYGKFTHFARRHKRKIYLIFILAITGGMALLIRDFNLNPAEYFARKYFERFAGFKEDFQYSLNNYYIDESHLRTQYYTLVRYTFGNRGGDALINDQSRYAEYINEQAETDLMVNAALNEGILDSLEARQIIENSVRRAIAEYYLFHKIRTAESDFNVTVSEKELNDHMQTNQKYFLALDLDANGKRQVAYRSLLNAKRQFMQEEINIAKLSLVKRLKEQAGYRVK